MTDSRGAKFMRGLVKTVFIFCFAAFMYASIGHLAVFFQNYEEHSGGDVFGSYLVAGSIDVTALVTTTGVMFFRKSMPRHILAILWVFIVGLALYSFLINWEYASHFQDTSILLQPTGKTTPVYDTHGVLHYVPEEQLNTNLEAINPALASCFTIFALIYSIVGEFFGSKIPTAAELLKKKQYLESTAGLLDEIKSLEDKGKGPGVIARAKAAALEIKAAAKALKSDDGDEEETDNETDQDTDTLPGGSPEENENDPGLYEQLSEAETSIAKRYPKSLPWLTKSDTTISLKEVARTLEVSMKLLRNRVGTKNIRATRNKEIVFKNSVIEWALAELLPAENRQASRANTRKAEGESHQDTQQNTRQIDAESLDMVEYQMLKALRKASSAEQQELRGLAESKTLDELTHSIKERYPQYAGYFGQKEVANVMAVFKNEQELRAV